MKLHITHDRLGEIDYEESFWTGKKRLSIGGKELTKLSSKQFRDDAGKEYRIKGYYIMGVTLLDGTEEIRLSPAPKWYEIVLSLLPLILTITWGNSTVLCSFVPIVGGAIGGLIGGVLGCLNFVLVKRAKALWLKIVISVGMLAACFLVCYLIALAILAAL